MSIAISQRFTKRKDIASELTRQITYHRRELARLQAERLRILLEERDVTLGDMILARVDGRNHRAILTKVVVTDNDELLAYGTVMRGAKTLGEGWLGDKWGKLGEKQ